MNHDVNIPVKFRQYVPPDQQFIATVKRHIIGLLYIYATVLAAVAALVFIIAMARGDLLGAITGKELSMLSGVGVLLAVLVVFVLILVTNIYNHNSLVITDKETIQILQRGVFQVKVSHLSHADVEDVTAEQNGLMATLVSYGTLHIETSGELKNFEFRYCPNPEKYARIVLQARQKFTESSSG